MIDLERLQVANRPDDPADGNPPSTFAVIGYDQWYQAVGAELESPLAVEGVKTLLRRARSALRDCVERKIGQ